MSENASPLPTIREHALAQLRQPRVYDMAIVGGGATGLGLALDAAQRGLSVVLVDSHDFAQGTSSRSTKLLHGGVRYLAQGNIGLVREALHERTTVLHIAPGLAHPLAFVIPAIRWWERAFYGAGLTLYDWLAGSAGLGPTRILSAAETRQHLPTARAEGLRGGVLYWDAQFDDARLAIALARTAAAQGALLLNYCAAKELLTDGSKVTGLRCEDTFSGEAFTVQARCVVNATGVWVDHLRAQEQAACGVPDAGQPGELPPLVAPSQGIHIVVDRRFLASDAALMVPKTSDGRVLFAVPWLGKVILGTTDTPRQEIEREPAALREEVDFILRESARFLSVAPTRADILSIWVGLRPLVRPHSANGSGPGGQTKKISREHTILVGPGGMVTVTGGKWTTYRAMADDVLQLMDALGIARAHLVGHSTGGAIGQTIALDAPDRIDRLVLSATWTCADGYFRRLFATRSQGMERLGRGYYGQLGNLVLYPP
ncbi:MAG: FAD-dependent oxidoreductase, partial [Betaproteobacteria bacterium]|nr:FAD-dependent oxidoreductase [Betaproteobacteria bacterium]